MTSPSSCSLKCDAPFVCEVDGGKEWCVSPKNFVNLQKIMSAKKASTTPFPTLPSVLYRNAPPAPSPYYEEQELPSNSLFTAVLIALLGFITVSLIALAIWYRFCRGNPAWSARPRQAVATSDSPDALIVEKS